MRMALIPVWETCHRSDVAELGLVLFRRQFSGFIEEADKENGMIIAWRITRCIMEPIMTI